MTPLELFLVYLLAAVLGVVIFRSFRLPTMIGYLAVGVIVGPHVLGMMHNTERIRHLAELGVVFLMFVIGLEFNLPKLRTMKRHVFGLGLLQVVITMLAGMLALLALRWALPKVWNLSWQGMVALSAVLAMSSTAIVIKLVSERLELDTEYGKRAVGVLLFQDLAVVPLLILVPALASHNNDISGDLLLALFKGVVLIGLLLTLGQYLMKRWMLTVARRRSDELFMLNVLLVTLGLAWLTEQVGLSMALGAFIAGMLISETPFKNQVEADIRPFHDLLLGLFFITIGMMLDWREVLARWNWVLLLVTVPVLFKAVLVWLLAWRLGASHGVALRTGLYLAQAGEFGFVLLNLSLQSKLVPAPLSNIVLASMVLSMMATPFIIQHAHRIVLRLISNEWMNESLQMTNIVQKAIARKQHVIICGYGRAGQTLGRLLDKEGIPFIALDLDPDRVRQASAAGETVVYGDAARLSALASAGLARASAVAITFLHTPQALHVLDHIRKHAPHVPVVVRSQDDHDLETLRAAGATEVVPEAIEGSLLLAGHALALVGVPMRKVIRAVQKQRNDRYSLLRGFFHGADDDLQGDTQDYERLETFAVPENSRSVGQAVQAMLPLLEKHHVTLVSVRQANGRTTMPEATLPIAAGDTLVLKGTAAGLAEVVDVLTQA